MSRNINALDLSRKCDKQQLRELKSVQRIIRNKIEDHDNRFISQEDFNSEVRRVIQDELNIYIEDPEEKFGLKPIKQYVAECKEFENKMKQKFEEERKQLQKELKEQWRRSEDERRREEEARNTFKRECRENMLFTPEWLEKTKKDILSIFPGSAILGIGAVGFVVTFPWLKDIYYLVYWLVVKPMLWVPSKMYQSFKGVKQSPNPSRVVLYIFVPR